MVDSEAEEVQEVVVGSEAREAEAVDGVFSRHIEWMHDVQIKNLKKNASKM